jgi:curved DNA-binding protein CbpA
MTDYFAVLQQPRRPWLDPDKLKQQYQEIALNEHPDRKPLDVSADPNTATPDFAAVNEAYRVLNNPKLRLQHLLSLETNASSETSTIPADLMEPFMQAAALIPHADGLLQKLRGATNALSKSLLRPEMTKVQVRTALLVKDLQKSYDLAIEQLRRLDEVWDSKRSETIEQLRILSRRFAYLERWLEQLRERQFQLSS